MVKRRLTQLGEHPLVRPIEGLFTSAAERSMDVASTSGGRIAAERAVWLCACIYDEDVLDTPTWLVYETSDGCLGWCRVPPGTDVTDVVESAVLAGDHVGPEDVLLWLQGSTELGQGEDERATFLAVGHRIRDLFA